MLPPDARCCYSGGTVARVDVVVEGDRVVDVVVVGGRVVDVVVVGGRVVDVVVVGGRVVDVVVVGGRVVVVGPVTPPTHQAMWLIALVP